MVLNLSGLTRVWKYFLPLILVPAVSASYSSGVEQTVGSEHYLATKISAEAGGKLRISPTFYSYESDASSGTYRTYSLDLGYHYPRWHWDVMGGVTPEVDNYSNKFLGVEAGIILFAETAPRKQAGSEEGDSDGIGLKCGAFRVVHSDRSRSTSTSRKGPFVESDPATDVVQTDFNIEADLPNPWVSVSFKIVESRYGRELDRISMQEARRIVPRGSDFIIRGFPKTSYVADLEATVIPMITPYVSLTSVKYELDAPSAKGVEIGFESKIKKVSLDLSYEPSFDDGEGHKLHYVTLGMNVRF